jgi:hypothetical protein
LRQRAVARLAELEEKHSSEVPSAFPSHGVASGVALDPSRPGSRPARPVRSKH